MSSPWSSCTWWNSSTLPAVRWAWRSGVWPQPIDSIWPALAPDAPDAISPRSRSVTRRPWAARWNAADAPEIPPPITTTSASARVMLGLCRNGPRDSLSNGSAYIQTARGGASRLPLFESGTDVRYAIGRLLRMVDAATTTRKATSRIITHPESVGTGGGVGNEH